MATNGFLAYDSDSMVERPLTELPTLRVADPARDVRGWEVGSHDGRRLGTVADLLVDIDRLKADTLLVAPAGSDRAGAMVVVPLHALSPEHGSNRRLVPGTGMPPIGLRYQSTTRYSIWVAIAVAIIAGAGWVLGLFE
jgi:sporulation protein YlmC with PRC-barrel domain